MDTNAIPLKFYRSTDESFPRANTVGELITLLGELPVELATTYDAENERLRITACNTYLDNPHLDFEEVGVHDEDEDALHAHTVGELIAHLQIFPEAMMLSGRPECKQFEIVVFNVKLRNPHLSLEEVDLEE